MKIETSFKSSNNQKPGCHSTKNLIKNFKNNKEKNKLSTKNGFCSTKNMNSDSRTKLSLLSRFELMDYKQFVKRLIFKKMRIKQKKQKINDFRYNIEYQNKRVETRENDFRNSTQTLVFTAESLKSQIMLMMIKRDNLKQCMGNFSRERDEVVQKISSKRLSIKDMNNSIREFYLFKDFFNEICKMRNIDFERLEKTIEESFYPRSDLFLTECTTLDSQILSLTKEALYKIIRETEQSNFLLLEKVMVKEEILMNNRLIDDVENKFYESELKKLEKKKKELINLQKELESANALLKDKDNSSKRRKDIKNIFFKFPLSNQITFFQLDKPSNEYKHKAVSNDVNSYMKNNTVEPSYYFQIVSNIIYEIFNHLRMSKVDLREDLLFNMTETEEVFNSLETIVSRISAIEYFSKERYNREKNKAIRENKKTSGGNLNKPSVKFSVLPIKNTKKERLTKNRSFK